MTKVEDKEFKVEKIVWYSEDSHWGVLATEPIDKLGEVAEELTNKYGNISISGNFEGVYEGAKIKVTGEVTEGKYGKQIQIKMLTVLHDTSDKEGAINFLSKSVIKGISVQNAKKIYEAFGEKSIDVVLNKPQVLINISGIGQKTVAKIKESVGQYKRMEPLIKYCANLGLGYSLIRKLDEELGEEALEVIQSDPYKVLELAPSIPFKQVDSIFLKSGGNPTSNKRLETGLLYTLKNLAVLEGSTGCKSFSLKTRFYKLLDLSGANSEYESTAWRLSEVGKVYLSESAITGSENGIVYYAPYLEIERSISEKIKNLNLFGVQSREIKEEVIQEEISDFPFTLNEQQVEAVRKCLKSNVAVLTGAGGTGKSSITKAVARIYARSGYNVVLLSPTAKACRRLEECVGAPAQTIHKFLGMKRDGEFKGNDSYTDTVLIIDEASMLDIILFNNLLTGTTLTSKVLLIGDNNQLPSVQAGNVLGDLIDSENVNTSLLTDVMRQQEDSNIIKYCTMINNGEVMDPCEHSDFHYEEFGEGGDLKEFFYKKYLEEVKANGLNEVQVIAPYKKGELGMDNLNSFIQRNYNENGLLTLEDYKMGDKVRHTVNNYKKDVYNGETGTIIGFDSEEELIRVDYGNKVIEYEKQDLDELTLSYASTVHSSQGSEYRVVFVILDDDTTNDFLHIRRLLYTAVSRGKKRVYVLTKPYLVDKCITNNSFRPRITKLKEYMMKG